MDISVLVQLGNIFTDYLPPLSILSLLISIVAFAYSVRTRSELPLPKGQVKTFTNWERSVDYARVKEKDEPDVPKFELHIEVHNRGMVPLHIRELGITHAESSDDKKSWVGDWLVLFQDGTETIDVGGPPADFVVHPLLNASLDWLNVEEFVAWCLLTGGEVLEHKFKVSDEQKELFKNPGVHRHFIPYKSVSVPKASQTRRRWYKSRLRS